MRWTYDVDVRAFYLYIDDDAVVDRQIETHDGAVVDLDSAGRPVGVELISLSPFPDVAALAACGVPNAALSLLAFVAAHPPSLNLGM